MKKLTLIALALLPVAGCGGISEVAQIGKDTYMIASSSTRVGTGGGNLKVELYKRAAEYCATKNTVLSPSSSSSIDWAVGRPASAEITFRCLLESDPEWQRPDMKHVPNTTVEVIQNSAPK